MERGLTTADAARLAGVTTTTVKRWADQGLLPFERTAGGHRRFDRTAVERALRQRREPEGGDPLVAFWLECILGGKRYEIDGQLLAARARLGSWFRVADEVGLVLAELGRRWQSGEVSIAEEHAASELLARALTRAGDAMPIPPGGPQCLLACAPGDEHTLGLALVELCLREMGIPTLWVGRKTPPDELVRIVRAGEIGMLAVSASAASDDPAVLRALARELGRACAAAGVDLVLGGAGAWPENLSRATRLRSVEALHDLLQARASR